MSLSGWAAAERAQNRYDVRVTLFAGHLAVSAAGWLRVGRVVTTPVGPPDRVNRCGHDTSICAKAKSTGLHNWVTDRFPVTVA